VTNAFAAAIFSGETEQAHAGEDVGFFRRFLETDAIDTVPPSNQRLCFTAHSRISGIYIEDDHAYAAHLSSVVIAPIRS